MPASYEIDPQQRLVISRAWGVLSDDDLHEHYAALTADPAFDPSFRQLADMRDVTRVTTSSTAIEEAAEIPAFTPGVRRAVVAAADLHFGLARMFAAYAESLGQEVRVFRELGAAREWLGL